MTKKFDISLQPKQLGLANDLDNDELTVHGIGGAKAGGKTDALRRIMLLRRFKYPKTMGLMFRRVYNDLNDTHITRLFREYPFLRPWFNKNERLLSLPNGSSVRFGYAEYDDDINSMNGKEFHDIFIDQAEQCSPYMIDMLKGCKRAPSGSELRKANIVMSFNPGGPGHDWLKRRFVDGERSVDEEREGWKFTQAYAWDNAHWVREALSEKKYTVKEYYSWTDAQRRRFFLVNAPYAQTLKSFSDPNLVDAYLWGKWDVFSGQFFSMLKDDVHLCSDEEYIDSHAVRKAAIDWGNVTVFVTGARDYNGEIIVDDALRVEAPTPSEKAEIIGRLILNRGLFGLQIIGDTDMFGDMQGYAGADKSVAKIFRETWDRQFTEAGRPDGVPRLIQVSKRREDQTRYRVVCNDAFKEYLRWELDKETGEFKIRPRMRFKQRIKEQYDTLKTLQYDENNPEDVDDKIGSDHFYDAAKMLLMSLRTPAAHVEPLTFEKDPRAFILQSILSDRPPMSGVMIQEDGTFAEEKNFMQY